ncbi:MAG: hypothetical protein AAF740_15435 [Bacteroidota bacterium]
MKLVLQDKNKKQFAELRVDQFTGNLIQGTITASAFDKEPKQEIVSFQELVDSFVFGELLDEAAKKLDDYGWEIDGKDWIIFDFQVFDEKSISFRIKDASDYYLVKEVNVKLEELRYDNRWMMYGYLTVSDLSTQYEQYLRATANPESIEAENGYQHTAYLRHYSFWNISEKKSSFTDDELGQLIELVKCDEDKCGLPWLYILPVDTVFTGPFFDHFSQILGFVIGSYGLRLAPKVD